MKKFIFSAIAAIGLLLSPSCSDENEVLSGSDNEALVSFNVNLADGISTKAISDGKTVNTLHVRVFEDESGNPGALVTALSNDNITVTNKNATATMQLVKGKKYHLLFWADYHNGSAANPYTIGEDGKTISVSYTSATCNDEKRDAFFATITYTVPNASSFDGGTVTLKRPFAQLNFLVDGTEINAAKAMGLDFAAAKTKIEMTYAATTFSPFESANKITGTATPAPSFDFANVPFGSDLSLADKTTITGVTGDYYYLATTYVLAAGNADKVTLTVNDGTENYTTEFPNIPFKQNYRTNIYGKLLTEQGTFTVSVDKNFDGEDINKQPSDLQP